MPPKQQPPGQEIKRNFDIDYCVEQIVFFCHQQGCVNVELLRFIQTLVLGIQWGQNMDCRFRILEPVEAPQHCTQFTGNMRPSLVTQLIEIAQSFSLLKTALNKRGILIELHPINLFVEGWTVELFLAKFFQIDPNVRPNQDFKFNHPNTDPHYVYKGLTPRILYQEVQAAAQGKVDLPSPRHLVACIEFWRKLGFTLAVCKFKRDAVLQSHLVLHGLMWDFSSQ